MKISEAAKRSEYAPFTLRMFCRTGEILASKPRGNRGGWDINESSFDEWLRRRRIERSNEKIRAARRASL